MSTHSPFISTPLTISALLKKSAELSTGSDTPRLDVEVLLSHILEKDRSFLYTWPEHQLNEQQQQCFDGYFQRRCQGEPVAHIIGQREFWSLPFKVTPATLIPRPETELLVELALGLRVDDRAEVLDLGTGTGAIALALASEKNHWQITAVVAVPAAVQLAEENRQQLNIKLPNRFANVQVFQSDWFTELKGQLFDVIISNPPYICEGDQHLKQGDVRFEPLSALVADEQGLSDLQAIINGAQIYLKPNGWLLLEHGFDQGAAVQEMMLNAGYESVATHTDLAGKDRVSLCCKSS
jgi:release factor glutamine methyltransferase